MNTIKNTKKDLPVDNKERDAKSEKLSNLNKKPVDDQKLPNSHSKHDQVRKSK